MYSSEKDFERIHLTDEDTVNDIDRIVSELEDEFLDDFAEATTHTPDPLAPLEERVAYRIAMAQLRARGDILGELRQLRDGSKPE